MYVCLCFGVTEQQVRSQIEAGAESPRQIASACRAGTDCGGCVRRIQSMLGRPAVCRRRAALADVAAPPSPRSVATEAAEPAAVPVPAGAPALAARGARTPAAR
ncbi:(2Fe-2S)-binding protein [Wenjunlia vitaminophila]|uniref:Bacterioferritin-associated ferredoxin n=1 Tax=Wenjunlia vitaminophila TaxID=76728 RepID=A0A0T6LVI2_WENVI|nr:(2Fe-2S)-binding protein [Wenjunlia vitaminophila]KRV50107.1 (2Fe-2S)-binding protein [Wenjunlia vitaminophila]